MFTKSLTDTELYQALLTELQAGWQGLPDKPEENPEATLRALWSRAAGEPLSVARAAGAPLPELDDAGLALLRGLIESRLAGVPLAHLTERQSFMGLELLAGPDALIPRRETELLGWAALERLRELAAARGRVTILDLCAGAGNLAVALANHEPACTVHASDISSAAIVLAEKNVARFGLQHRATCVTGDLFAPFEDERWFGAFDLIVCNPPYITAARVAAMPQEISGFEPRLAFDGGALGVQIILRLIMEAPRFLKPDSWLCFEVGAGQGPYLLKRLRGNDNFAECTTVPDATGEIRAILARTRG